MNPSFAAPPSLTSLFPAGGQVGTTVEVTASGTFDPWPVEGWASAKGITATAAKEKGKLSVRIAADASPGVAWLRLADASGASPLRPFLVGVLPEVLEKEPNDDAAKPQLVDRPAVVNGKLGKGGDVDVFAVKLTKGQTLVAALEANHTLRSPMDAVLQVVSEAGFVLDQSHDHRGLDPHVAFVAPKDGTYLVRVFAFPSQPDSSIRFFGTDACVYRLTLTTGGVVDYPLPLATKRGTKSKIETVGWNLSTPPLVPGAVAVREEEHACFDFTAKAADSPLSVPFTLTGRVKGPHATNNFPVTVTKGTRVTLAVESRTLELPLTPVLRVLDETGKQLARAEPAKPNADCELTLVPTKDEVVTVEVRDLYHDGGPRFVYRLRATPPEPNVEATVPNDRFALAPGTPLDIPLTLAFKGGLALAAADFGLTSEGLPPEVKVELVPGDTKAMTPPKVRLTTDKAALSTAFRLNLVGTFKTGPKLVRPVRAALSDFETTTADLWLTVGAGAKVAPPMPKKKK